MDQGSLVMQEIEAGARFVHEFAKNTSVQAAFWLRASEDDRWFLYVASDQIDDTNFGLAYGEVVRIMGTMPDPWLHPLQIKVIGTDDPLARAVLEIQQKYPGQLPMRVRSGRLGGVSIEDAYIYEIPIAVSN